MATQESGVTKANVSNGEVKMNDTVTGFFTFNARGRGSWLVCVKLACGGALTFKRDHSRYTSHSDVVSAGWF